MPIFPKAKFEIVADDKTKKGVDSATSNLDKLKKQISLMGVASVAAAGIGGLAVLTTAGIRLGDELAKTSDKLGLSTEALAGLRNAARLTGVETSKLDMGLQRMTRRIAEAAVGTGEAQGALKELGLDAKRLADLSPDQQFAAIAEQMEKVGSQSDKVRLGFKLFDSEGVDLIRTLDLGTAGLQAAANEADRFGTAISRVQARQIEYAADAMGNVRTAAEGLSIQLAARFAPTLTEMANRLADFIAKINEGAAALSFFGEKFLGLESDVRGLGFEELGARAELLQEQLAAVRVEYEKTKNTHPLFPGRGRALDALSGELQRLAGRLAEVTQRQREFTAGAGETELFEILPGSLPQKRDDSGAQAILRRARERQQQETDVALEGIFRREEAEALAAQRAEERRQLELEHVRQSLMTREQLELEAFARREEIIVKNMEAGAERDAMIQANREAEARFRVELAQWEQDEINRAVMDGTATREQIEKASAETRAKAVVSRLQWMTQGVATHSRSMFEINKAAAIAGAILDAKEAVVGAYKFGAKIGGPVLGAAFAATAAAATAAQINAIRSTSFGGGSTPSAVGTTPTLGGQPLPASSTPAPSESPGSRQLVEVHVYGNGILLQDQLLGVIKDAVDNQDYVLVGGNSRNAAEIREATG